MKTYLGICVARLHQAKTNGHPDTSTKLDDAKNQDHSSKSHFGIVWVPSVCVCFRIIIIIILIIIRIVCKSDGYTVGNDDYSAKHSRCDGEPHENASLQHKIMKENMHSYHKLSCFTGTISVYKDLCLSLVNCNGKNDGTLIINVPSRQWLQVDKIILSTCNHCHK